jgi:hypothetical protein
VTRLDNPRSVANYAIQGTAADLMRLAVIYLTRNKAPLLGAIHDGFLFECPREDIQTVRHAVDASLRQALERLLPGAPLRWSQDVFAYRYRDPDGERMWQLVAGLIARPRQVQPSHEGAS